MEMRKVRKIMLPDNGQETAALYLECGHVANDATYLRKKVGSALGSEVPCGFCTGKTDSWARGCKDGEAFAFAVQAELKATAGADAARQLARRLVKDCRDKLWATAQQEAAALQRKQWAKGLYFGYWRALDNSTVLGG